MTRPIPIRRTRSMILATPSVVLFTYPTTTTPTRKRPFSSGLKNGVAKRILPRFFKTFLLTWNVLEISLFSALTSPVIVQMSRTLLPYPLILWPPRSLISFPKPTRRRVFSTTEQRFQPSRRLSRRPQLGAKSWFALITTSRTIIASRFATFMIPGKPRCRTRSGALAVPISRTSTPNLWALGQASSHVLTPTFPPHCSMNSLPVIRETTSS